MAERILDQSAYRRCKTRNLSGDFSRFGDGTS